MQRRFPNFDIIRLFLALEVVADHAWSVYHASPLWRGGIVAVPAFLAISGCLVLKSFSSSPSWGIFALKRILRVLPALLLSFVLCLFLFNKWVLLNSVLQWLLGGLDPELGEKNMPLWSLAWEEIAYFCLVILWTLGAYQYRSAVWALLGVSLLLVSSAEQHFPPAIQVILWLAPSFFIGNLAYLHRVQLQKIPGVVPWILLVSICVVGYFMPVSIALQAFAVVWVGMSGSDVLRFKIPDLSYGAYIYHYPIIMYLHEVIGISTAHGIFLTLPIPLLAMTIFSWYAVEKPALSMKRLLGSARNIPGALTHHDEVGAGRPDRAPPISS